tara:strand:+ start:110 stop:334 length:225 start_codon:yes stop_codon:yes gene_type:complete
MLAGFQPSAFQNNAFQVLSGSSVITTISGISKAGIGGITHVYILPPATTIVSSTSRSAPNSITSITYLIDGEPL